MIPVELFTWNLSKQPEAHDLAIEYLAKIGQDCLFVACLQELPGPSPVALARREEQQTLKDRGIQVVPSVKTVVPGLAIVHHPLLNLVMEPIWDEDGEFVAAVFELPSSSERLAVVGVHAKSQVDMKPPEDRGGSRALLRQAINALGLNAHRVVILGDFNSEYRSLEIGSWHTFYAISEGRKFSSRNKSSRRGHPHPPYYVVRPQNAEGLGTFWFTDDGSQGPKHIDFIVVDETLKAQASAEIMTVIHAVKVWDSLDDRPEVKVSDHLPVKGTIQI